MHDLLTISEAARYLGIGEYRVRHLTNTGQLPCQRTTRNGTATGWRLFTMKDLAHYKTTLTKERRNAP